MLTDIKDKVELLDNGLYEYSHVDGNKYLMRRIHGRMALRRDFIRPSWIGLDPRTKKTYDKMIAFAKQIPLTPKPKVSLPPIDKEVKKVTLKKALAALQAVITGVQVSEDRQKKRLEICMGIEGEREPCDKLRIDKGGNLYCGICGCKISGNKSLINLTIYEEVFKYGCKHPSGSRWRAEGV